MATNRQTLTPIEELVIELEDALLSSHGTDFTQNEAAKKRVVQAKAQLARLFKEKMLEVIGEDEPESNQWKFELTRNDLRQKQRAKLDQLIKQEFEG